MGYWKCRIERRVEVPFRNSKGEMTDVREIEGKVLGFPNLNEYHSGMVLVLKEGKDPIYETVYPNFFGDRKTADKIVYLKYIK